MSCEHSTFAKLFILPLCPAAKLGFRKIFRVSVEGLENVPKGSFIVASNHRSYLDPPVLNSVFPEPLHFLAKEELFKNPILSFFLRHARAIPLRRGAGDIAVLEMAVGLLRRGCSVCIFPEGTRAAPGEFLKPKLGVGLLAVKSGAQILPVYVEGTDRVLPRGSKLPSLGSPIRVVIGKPKRYREPREGAKVYRKVALEIMESIKELAKR